MFDTHTLASSRRPTMVLAVAIALLLISGSVAAIVHDDGGGRSTAATEDGPSTTSLSSSTTLEGQPALGPVATVDDPAAPDTSNGKTTTTARGLSGSAPTTTLANAAPVRIGNVGTYSGGLAPLFAPGRQVLEAWAASVNKAGGVQGHTVELVVRDDTGDAAEHLAMVRELVEQQHVVAFVGNLSMASGSAADYLEHAGVPVVGGDALSAEWSTSSAFFPVGSGVAGQAYSLVELAVASGLDHFALLNCAEGLTYCIDSGVAADHAVAAFGRSVVYRGAVTATQPSYATECQQLGQTGAKVVVLFSDATTVSRFQHACPDVPVIPGLLAVATGVTDSGTVASLPVLPWSSTAPAAAGYHALASTIAGLDEGYATSVAYASGRLFERAAALGRWPAIVTSANVRAGLMAMRGETLGGLTAPLTYTDGALRDPRCGFPLTSTGAAWSSVSATPRCY